MTEDENVEAGVENLWFIDFNWQKDRRAISILLRGCLCPEHRKQFEHGQAEAGELVDDIKNCCSRRPGFITGRMPIMESIFRLFLACGNEPLSLEELGKRLNEWRGGDTYRTSPEMLSHLLESDRYYSLNKFKG